MPQLRPKVTREGQPYVDDPVRVKPRADRVTLLQRAVASAVGNSIKDPAPITIGTERVRLNWRKPGK